MSAPLTEAELAEARAALPGWDVSAEALSKQFVFADFRTAIGAIVQIGFEAESLDHHPELTNVYNRLGVRLTTHDAGNRVTRRDLDLARRIDAVVPG